MFEQAIQHNASAHDGPPDASEPTMEFLTFTLGEEEYGVDILKVQEIRGYDNVTRLPDSPAFVKGVVNLRGTIVPVVDLRLKFRLSEPVYDEFTVMVILNMRGRIVGVVVDSVSDVIRLRRAQVQPAPELGAAVDTRFISGIGAPDESRMLILLDIDRLMSSEDMALFDREQD